MSKRMKLSFVVYLFVLAVAVLINIKYLTQNQVMPYHLEVIGTGWEQLAPGVKLMLVTLMNSGGMSGLCQTIAMLVILLIPFRKGEAWAKWAMPVVYLPYSIFLIYNAYHLQAVSGAKTPRGFLIFLLCFFLAAFLLSLGKTEKSV